MGLLQLRAWDPAARNTCSVPLRIPPPKAGPLRIEITPVRGASAVHLLLSGDNFGVRVEADVALDFETPITFEIGWHDAGRLQITTRPERRLLFLPGASTDALYEPAPPLPGVPPGPDAALDVIFLIDATSQMATPDGTGLMRRLAETGENRLRRSVAALAGELASAYPKFHCGLLAFSDTSLPRGIAAPELLSPREALRPAHAADWLRYRSVASFSAALDDVQPAPGGDWVDALAEGLMAIAREASWRPDARKLVVVVGDSPGHSLLPSMVDRWGWDAHLRSATTDEACDLLHRSEVEIAAICLPIPKTRASATPEALKAINHVRDQYRGLASLPEWYWETEDFAPAAAAALCRPPAWIARGASYGLVITSA